MKSIVAVDRNWGIGKNNDLLFRISADMRYFKQSTINKIIVMGSNTLKSFPGGNPLPNRLNVVLYPDGEKREDCVIVDSLEELREVLAQYESDDIFVVGGAMFYKTMLPYCDTVYVTKVDADGGAQVFYENLDDMENWEMTECGEPNFDCGYSFRFCKYINKNTLDFFGGKI